MKRYEGKEGIMKRVSLTFENESHSSLDLIHTFYTARVGGILIEMMFKSNL